MLCVVTMDRFICLAHRRAVLYLRCLFGLTYMGTLRRLRSFHLRCLELPYNLHTGTIYVAYTGCNASNFSNHSETIWCDIVNIPE